MISDLLNELKNKGFKLSNLEGVSNVAQLAKSRDVLILYCKTQQQLNDLLARSLPENFEGLVIAPFASSVNCNLIVKTLKEMASIEKDLIEDFYPMPKSLPKIIGVTGTNGKTSVAWTVAELARIVGKVGLYAGTPGVFINGEKKPDKVITTTPSFLDLRKLLHKYGPGVDVVAIEVSSHALAQDRLKSFPLDAAGWTNFSQDHLDFHKTMEHYFEAKRKIVDLPQGEKVFFPCQERELKKRACFANGLLADDIGAYKIKDLPSIFSLGFPKTNLELALALYSECFGRPDEIDLSSLRLPPGRFQEVNVEGRVFIVDYAHTPEALESVLNQMKDTFDKKILTVFGCGGDRDRSKRPLMARAAATLSDKVIVTSDNPRSEDPQSIIKDVVGGISDKPYLTEVDRKKAIELAFKESDDDWVILVAGKGHEDYQEIGGIKHPFDDVLVIKGLRK